MSSSFSGSQLVRCSTCQHSFTPTHWRLHGHNPEQIICRASLCRRRAVGYQFTGGNPLFLCGGHLLEAQRRGAHVTFVDGRVCRVCDGHGQVNAQELRVGSPGGEWRNCPECLGTGYDATLRSAPSPRPIELRPPRSPGPSRRETRAERAVREARERQERERVAQAERSEAARQQRLQRAVGSSSSREASDQGPRLAPGSRAVDISAFEREFNRRRRARRRGDVVGTLIFSAISTLAGAVLGALFIYPVLPDSAAEIVNSLQQWVSERFAR